MLLILDLAVGLSFVYLLFSLFVTALNEMVLTFFNKRAAFFKEGITELLGRDPVTVENFLAHGLVDSFSREEGRAPGDPSRPPAYLPPDAFVSAVLDQVIPVAFDPNTPGRVRDLVAIAAALSDSAVLPDNPKLKQSLRALLDRADGDLGRFKVEVATWFNQSMDRVTGWYKRYAQHWLFGLALAGAVSCNVDSIHIIQGLTADPKLRDALVTEATDSARQKLENDQDQGTDQVGQAAKQIKDSLAQLNSVSLPIGWGDAQWNYLFADLGHGHGRANSGAKMPGSLNAPATPNATPAGAAAPATSTGTPAAPGSPTAVPAGSPVANPGAAAEIPANRGWNGMHILSACVGWFLTALAASLGAPFWFDTLQRVINIRGNGRSPAEMAKIEARKVTEKVKDVATLVAAGTPNVGVGSETLINAPQTGGS